jgi:hypothetical protein
MYAFDGSYQREARIATTPHPHGLVDGTGENDFVVRNSVRKEAYNVDLICMALEGGRDSAK